MNPKSKAPSRLAFAALIAASASLTAAPVIYEPFAQTAGALNGKAASSTGLTGNWTATTGASAVNVLNPDTITHGALANSDGQVDALNSGNTNARVTRNTDLATAGLLADGAELWFSLVFQKTAGGGGNEWAGFAFGTSYLTAGPGALTLQGGNGLGFRTRSNAVEVATWNGTTTPVLGGSLTVAYNTPTVIVGKINWGATASDVETITLYKPSLDLSSLGTGVSKTMAAVDQTLFTTISFAQRDSAGTQTYDEIRFGATQTDVLPADTVAPTLLSITDDKAGGPIGEDVEIITYDLTFDRHMDLASFQAADFANAGEVGDATISIGTITQPSPTVIRVQVLPTTTGTVRLRIVQDTTIKSLAQVNLNTSAALPDDTTITINAGPTPPNTPTANRWWDGSVTSGVTDGVSQPGGGTWSTSNTNWDRGAGFEAPVAWGNTGSESAIFSGSANAAYTATLSETINLKDLTFDTTGTTGARYTISGGTLNFASGGVIRATNNQYDQTITSSITGSPAVETKDFGAGNTYKGLIFAPATGNTQTLGAVLNPNNTGTTDKAGLTLAGSTTGNSVASINYAGGDRYGDTNLQSGEWSIPGGIRTGTLRVSGGTHTIGGFVRCNYGSFQVNGGKVKGAFTIAPEQNTGAYFASGTTIAPGNSVGTVTFTATADATKFELRTGSSYEWEVGAANATDTINITKGTLDVQSGVTLKVLDAGGTPAVGDLLTVFTYSAGVTTPSTATLQANVTIDLSGSSYTGTPSIVNDTVNRVIYVTGISSGPATPYDTWVNGFDWSSYTTPDLTATGNPDGDAYTNLQEFAFAFNPAVSDGGGTLTISGGSITQNGPPQIYEDPDTHQFFLRYTRRADYVAAGLTYTAQFAADSLGAGSFEDVAGGSVVVTGTGAGGVAIQAVSIEFPDALPVSGKKARFGRVEVTQTP